MSSWSMAAGRSIEGLLKTVALKGPGKRDKANMQRREFLITSAMALGSAARPLGWMQPPQSKTDRLAIMVYSFQRVLKLAARPSSPERTLEVSDVPEMFADRYKVHNVEMQHNYFESTEASFFKDFLARLAKTRSRVSNINLELGNMNIAAPDPALRAQAIDLTRAWIDHAVLLGSPRVMINQGKLTQENKAAAIEALTHMTAYGQRKKIMVGAEPRGDDFTLLTEVIRAGGAYTNPDVGNFGGDQAHQHDGIRAMFPYTGGNCHMKMLNPATYDLAAAIALIKSLGYTGLYSIENEQQGDPYENVQKVYDLVLANI
jgi:sugar phosphate isomerase/epimerase